MNNPSHNHKSTVPGQMSLTELLDQIEQRAKAGSSREGGHRIALYDVPKLVKALNRAIDYVRADLPKSRADLIESDIAQLLSADSGSTVSEKKDLEIKDA